MSQGNRYTRAQQFARMSVRKEAVPAAAGKVGASTSTRTLNRTDSQSDDSPAGNLTYIPPNLITPPFKYEDFFRSHLMGFDETSDRWLNGIKFGAKANTVTIKTIIDWCRLETFINS